MWMKFIYINERFLKGELRLWKKSFLPLLEKEEEFSEEIVKPVTIHITDRQAAFEEFELQEEWRDLETRFRMLTEKKSEKKNRIRETTELMDENHKHVENEKEEVRRWRETMRYLRED